MVTVPALPEMLPVIVLVKVFAPVKVLFEYVFAIVEDASAKKVALVVENALPWLSERKFCALEVEKKSRVLFHASAEVVENARPWLFVMKFNADVVEKPRPISWVAV